MKAAAEQLSYITPHTLGGGHVPLRCVCIQTTNPSVTLLLRFHLTLQGIVGNAVHTGLRWDIHPQNLKQSSERSQRAASAPCWLQT